MSGNYQYLNAALEDRLHQPYRIPLITGTEAVLRQPKRTVLMELLLVELDLL